MEGDTFYFFTEEEEEEGELMNYISSPRGTYIWGIFKYRTHPQISIFFFKIGSRMEGGTLPCFTN